MSLFGVLSEKGPGLVNLAISLGQGGIDGEGDLLNLLLKLVVALEEERAAFGAVAPSEKKYEERRKEKCLAPSGDHDHRSK